MIENQFFSSDFKLGILGGGQLGKMLLYDSIRYDIYTKIMDPNKNAPCHKICDEFIVVGILIYLIGMKLILLVKSLINGLHPSLEIFSKKAW